MRVLIRFLVLLALFAMGPAHALIPKVPTPAFTNATWNCSSACYSTNLDTAQAACDRAMVSILAERSTIFSSVVQTQCIAPTAPGVTGSVKYTWTCKAGQGCTTGNTSAAIFWIQTGATTCPANSAASGAQCACAAGFEENSAHNACVPKKTENEVHCGLMGAGGFTRGMTGKTGGSVPATSCFLTDPPFPGEEGKGCLMETSDSVMVPRSDGLRDFSATGKYTGGTCTPAADPVLGDPKATKEDKCPGGFEGMVNGTSKCIASEPDKGIDGVKNTTKNNPDGSTTKIKEETKCTGEQCTTTRTETNTPAGGGAPTISISGTTQSLADKCALDKTNPVCTKTGTTPPTQNTSSSNGDEEGGLECGIDDKPACKVKVDETGTPNGAGAISQDGLNTAMDKAEAGIAKAIDRANMDTSWGGVPSWFSTGSCTPWQLGTLPIINKQITLNICVIQPYVIGVMSFLWVVGTFFAIIGMVGRVVGSGVH